MGSLGLFDLDSLTLVPAYWQITPSAPRTIDVIGIHSAEAQELPTLAESLGRYFQSHPDIVGHWVDGKWVQRKASTHLGIDSDSVGLYVDFDNIAYAAGGINLNGVHLEHAGYARQTRAEWLDEYSLPMLRLSASVTAALCVRYAIPAVWLSPADLLAKQRGITSHVNACIAFGGDHWDPGPEFPEDLYVDWVRDAMTPPPKDHDMPDYILRNGHDHAQPWLAVYPNGALRHIGGTEAGCLINGKYDNGTQFRDGVTLQIVDELDTAAYERARQSVGA